jgi:hypothetical protein
LQDCVKQYCYDGWHYSANQEGVPAWVKAYFDGRKGEELRRQYEQSKIDTARQSAEGVRRSKEWND